MKDEVLSMLGICKKAGKTVSGEKLIEEARKGKVAFVVIAADASDNSVKKITAPLGRLHIDYRKYGTKEDLGDATGASLRSSVGITDEGLALSVKKKIDAAMA